ncbi:MAG: NADH-quinone oxidoreductase subunit A [Elusimicrobia bacterium]|nr:NADH-quinone oxidoreductase subunit A [Elusimicrobiota bacterium]
MYLSILILSVFAVAFALITLLLSYLLRPKVEDALKREVYECGIEATGDTRIKTNFRFYTFALLFVIFDLEVLYLFPWAVVVKSANAAIIAEMFVFIGIIAVGFVYAWKKGALKWE